MALIGSGAWAGPEACCCGGMWHVEAPPHERRIIKLHPRTARVSP